MVDDPIAESAAGPQHITIDGRSTSEHALSEQIAADKYRRANAASGRRGFGIQVAKLIPHGAVLNPGDER